MLLLLLLLLTVVPVGAWQLARRRTPHHTWLVTGLALGTVVSPISFGLYATYFIPFIGLIPGMLGLVLSSVHGAPGYYASVLFGLVPAGTVVSESGHVVVEVINGAIWAPIYGAIGYLIDRSCASRPGRLA